MPPDFPTALQGSELENSTLYETKLFVHNLLARMNALERRVKELESRPAPEPDLQAHHTAPSPANHSHPKTFHEREQFLESIRSQRGGWDACALRQIGVHWPPPKGWRQHYLKTGKALVIP